MAPSHSRLAFRNLTSSWSRQKLRAHNELNWRMVRTVADFTQQLSSIHEQHAEELQLLVETFRKRNAELRRERPSYQSGLFTIWEVLLQEVEIDSQVRFRNSSEYFYENSMMLLEKTFHRKIQSRKIFLHRESFETILNKAEELLKKCHQDYSDAYKKLLSSRNHAQLAEYYDMHNAYVQQLRAANGMLEYYHAQILPKLLEELEHVYLDLSDTVAGSMVAAAEMLASKAREQGNHYDNLCSACRNVNSKTDLVNFIKTLNLEKATAPLKTHLFMAPRAENESGQVTPDPMLMLRNELVVERIAHLSLPNRSQSLRQDVSNLESQIRQLQEAVDSLTRLQQRSLESNLYNKSNELQEDISMKRFDLQVANIHLAAVRAQLELVASKEGNHSDENQHNRDRKTSTSSTAGMKNKWLKAFRSLKTGSINMPEKNDLGDKKNGKGPTRPQSATPSPLDTGQHIFQEYTYKKITPCDYCSQILRGHVRQGLKCKMCKMNVHADCQDKVSKCQPKPRLLRRQKSTSEIETKMLATEPEEDKQDVDPIYQLLKQAGDISGRRNDKDGSSQGGVGGSINSSLTSLHQRWPRSNASSSASSSSSHLLTVSSAHHEHMSSSGEPSNNKYECQEQLEGCYVVITGRTIGSKFTITVIDTSDPDWWQGKCLGKVGYFPSNYVTKLHPGEHPLQVTHTVQVTDGENGVKLLRDQPKPRLLRRQKSTSEIETKMLATEPEEDKQDVDPIYQLLKQAGDISGRRNDKDGSSQGGVGGSINSSLTSLHQRWPRSNASSSASSSSSHLLTVSSAHHEHMSSSAPHSPRRQKLSLRMKSFSLDSPESSEHVHRRHHMGQSSSHCSSHSQSPQSPQGRRQLLSAKTVRMSSVDLPDDNEKSLSSASTSPCPSPKPHRLLPTNLYVVLYNFRSRHADELDLKAGYTITVIDTSDPDWWQGKCLGKVGYFPSNYVTKLHPGEHPLQVTHTVQVTDGENGVKLLRDQIVIQVGEEIEGMVTIRTGTTEKIFTCPLKYLQDLQKPHRLLPTNLYVVLYNFRSRHADELDLKAGYTITVIDTSDPDWWQGKCLGKVGYFPSNYVTKLHPGEHPLQVTHTVQVTDGENGVKLLRDQIVIQVGEEIEGMVTIRTGTTEKIFTCPLKYLQDV
ncbi:uncharacterized protein LOC111628370 [Centruroides sculpturatus]|uniref:uncharacterized protein LOC111628370 n=1 Tax=Centruroides sculpturatus TaxID=218467 RepID=UPI000C6E961D|nr:uncharacterized protein LOC111628370 [Centruroides sculpturatus]